MSTRKPLCGLLALACLAGPSLSQEQLPRPGAAPIIVGSKAFTESHLLGAMLSQLIETHTDLEVVHKPGLGGTMICHAALLSGEIDLYPEYTGTAWTTVLKREERVSDALRSFLSVQESYARQYELSWLQPFGFNNTYVLAMSRQRAAALQLETIADLAGKLGELRAGFSHEFMNRPDGLPGLSEFYGIDFDGARGMEHALAYKALEEGELDLLDAYSTDAKLARLDLLRLRDERGFFPPYHAAPVVRRQTLEAHPELRYALDRLAFRIDDARMARLNLAVEEGGQDFKQVARQFLSEEGLLAPGDQSAQGTQGSQRESHWEFALGSLPKLFWLTLAHLKLSAMALGLAVLLGLPLAFWMVGRPRVARLALAAASAIQTVPGLALLALMIALPYLGLSQRSAIVALFLYCLLPILRSAHVGLVGIDPELLDAARGIGMRPREVLMRVRLPLAIAPILGGIRTAAVICIGYGTLAAFIGAGGLGEPIITGLYLNDTRLVLSGALAAAGLALLTDWLLGRLQASLTPRGLRAARAAHATDE